MWLSYSFEKDETERKKLTPRLRGTCLIYPPQASKPSLVILRTWGPSKHGICTELACARLLEPDKERKPTEVAVSMSVTVLEGVAVLGGAWAAAKSWGPRACGEDGG